MTRAEDNSRAPVLKMQPPVSSCPAHPSSSATGEEKARTKHNSWVDVLKMQPSASSGPHTAANTHLTAEGSRRPVSRPPWIQQPIRHTARDKSMASASKTEYSSSGNVKAKIPHMKESNSVSTPPLVSPNHHVKGTSQTQGVE